MCGAQGAAGRLRVRLRDDESSSAPFDLLISTADDDESTAQSSGTAQSGGDGTVLAVFLRVTNASLLTQPSYTIHVRTRTQS